MEDWVLWVIAAAVLTVGEVFTLAFLLGPIAIAAALAAVVAGAGAGAEVQVGVFAAASVASLAFIRPIAQRHLRTPAKIRTGTAALIGTRAVVIDRVSADAGSVKIGGEVWTARPFDEDQVIEPGVRVEVLQIRGATALVSE